MVRHDNFWPEHNGWWATAAARMADGTAADALWAEADPRIRALIGRVQGARELSADDVDDLVQSVLLRLCQTGTAHTPDDEPSLLHGVAQANAPAHYLRTAIHNLMVNERRRERRARASRAAERYAELVKRLRERNPATEAERREACQRVRFVVNHVIGREDREVLGLLYFEGLTTRQIAERLRLSHAAALKRLFRARSRVRIELSNLTT